MEEFKDIKSYEGLYKVNRQGEVDSYITNKKIKGSIDSNGYRQMHLSKNGEYKKKSLHRIVAEAFLPNPNNLPEVNHKDYNRANPNSDNLEWTTRKDNVRYSICNMPDYHGVNNPNYKNKILL